MLGWPPTGGECWAGPRLQLLPSTASAPVCPAHCCADMDMQDLPAIDQPTGDAPTPAAPHGPMLPMHASPAGVCVEQAEAHARVALHAVEKVDAKALPAPAHVAEGAVVDRAPRLVVPQVTDAAVV